VEKNTRIFLFRAMIPCALIFLLSMTPFLCKPGMPPNTRFTALLKRVADESDIGPVLAEAKALIEFQKTGAGFQSGTPACEPPAHLYFRLGEALLSRKDTLYREEALFCYEKAVELFPRLRHGWPYFQMGLILESMNQPEPARKQYQQVRQYDFSLLALRAGYRIAGIDDLRNDEDEPVRSRDLYAYFRFASEDALREIRPFLKSRLEACDEALYLQALAASAQGNPATATQRMMDFLAKHPGEPSALYYRDRFAGNPMQPFYPTDGNLLESCYAPRVGRDGGYLLTDDSRVMMDFYLPELAAGELVIDATFENDSETPIQLIFVLNDQIRETGSSEKEQGHCAVKFSPRKEANHLELILHVLSKAVDADTDAEAVVVNLRELRAVRVPSGKRT